MNQMKTIQFKNTCAYQYYFYDGDVPEPSEYKQVFQQGEIYEVVIKEDKPGSADVNL